MRQPAGECPIQIYMSRGMALHPPPNLPAMSTTLAPQMPLLPTTTVSPGSTRFAMQASMPANISFQTICWTSSRQASLLSPSDKGLTPTIPRNVQT